MPQLLNHRETDYVAIATELSKELATSAIARDCQGGAPDQEVIRLRQAGLLSLTIPTAYGGTGATWVEAYQVIRELSKSDGSIGQLYANHATLSVLPMVAGTVAQAERYGRLAAETQAFWGNALNARDARLKIVADGDVYRVNGIKSFGTGVLTADLRAFSAIQEGTDVPVVFVLPSDRPGILYNDDWNNMGQRRTASGSFTFNDVLVYPDEILGPPPAPESAFATLLFVVVQLSKTYIYLGIAQGALEAAKQYTMTTARPWLTSGVERATQDPFILHHYGEFWTELNGAIALANQAADQVQAAWDQGIALTFQERGEVAIAVASAKSLAVKVGLNITSQIFDVMGARATSARYGFDRYWRDLRTFSLHDPIDYKLRDIGNWVLNQQLPEINQYS
jgi:alkylation response protein AidB-like acyl-CoA dehydrogenase